MTDALKCVVWDLDDTLWRGVLLEGGGQELFPETRAVIEALDKRGILQSLASKNVAEEALARLKEFGLDEYFLYPQIHFGPKSESVAAIAKALNIGLNTFAFVDDQPYELSEVSSALPDVRCYLAESLAGLPDLPEFRPRFVTAESAVRRKLYQADIVRVECEENFSGPKESFLASLDMTFTILPVQGDDLERAADLTERTNQLNATGLTFSHDELDALRRSGRHLLHMAQLEDKFGSYGKIGLSLVEKDDEAWTIRLLLMSCRVMSRGVGSVLLNYIVRKGLEAGKKVRADFVETGRNRMMYITYKFAGFEEVSPLAPLAENDSAGGRLLLEYKGSGELAPPPWLKFVTD